METDYQTIQGILIQRTCTQRLARWLNLLSEFRPQFRWIPGNTNETADGLSRRFDFISEDGPASKVGMRELLQSILATPIGTDGDETLTSLHFTTCDQALMVFQLLSSRDIAQLCQENYRMDRNFNLIWEFLSKGGQVGAIPPKTFDKIFCITKIIMEAVEK